MNNYSCSVHGKFILEDHSRTMKFQKFLLILVVALPWSGHAAPPAAPVVASTSGRLLASSCFQCHSSSGFEGITGESASETISELTEMRARRIPEGIMDLVARGLTDAQIREIAAYLATLPETKGND
jgi:cytochrome c553